jgi:hypothetical protein
MAPGWSFSKTAIEARTIWAKDLQAAFLDSRIPQPAPCRGLEFLRSTLGNRVPDAPFNSLNVVVTEGCALPPMPRSSCVMNGARASPSQLGLEFNASARPRPPCRCDRADRRRKAKRVRSNCGLRRVARAVLDRDEVRASFCRHRWRRRCRLGRR